jgi:ML domain
MCVGLCSTWSSKAGRSATLTLPQTLSAISSSIFHPYQPPPCIDRYHRLPPITKTDLAKTLTMRILSLLLPFLSASLVASISLSDLTGDQSPLDNSFDVPGQNPMKVGCHRCRSMKTTYNILIFTYSIAPIPKITSSTSPTSTWNPTHPKSTSSPDNYTTTTTTTIAFPNPPPRGSSLNITASGIFSKDVEEGATVGLTVKYGLITLIHQTADLCEQIKNVDLECPLKKGKMSMVHSVKIPREAPMGKYTVLADVVTKDSEQVTCMEAVVYF